jgi:hypothetical protein
VAWSAFQPKRPTSNCPSGPFGNAPHATRDAVAVEIVGILAREDRRIGNGLEQPHAGDRGRQSRSQAGVERERAEGEVVHLVRRAPEARHLAIRETERLFGPAHGQVALGRDPRERALAQLLAVPGIGRKCSVHLAREPDDEDAVIATRSRRWRAAAVSYMAARARAPAVVRAKAVELHDRCGRLDPAGAEDTVAEREGLELFVGQLGQVLRERRATGLLHGGLGRRCIVRACRGRQ